MPWRKANIRVGGTGFGSGSGPVPVSGSGPRSRGSTQALDQAVALNRADARQHFHAGIAPAARPTLECVNLRPCAVLTTTTRSSLPMTCRSRSFVSAASATPAQPERHATSC